MVYHLTHITTKGNCSNIIQSNRFKPSVNDRTHIQWLGCGVYFWDSNDESSIKLGLKLVKNKSILSTLAIININYNVEDSNHMNLDDDDWANKFEEFLKINKNVDAQKMIYLLKIYKNKDNLETKQKNKLGRLFGRYTDFFIEYLKKEFEYKIDMVSYSFYEKKKVKFIINSGTVYHRQFCIKNIALLNEKDFKKFDITYTSIGGK